MSSLVSGSSLFGSLGGSFGQQLQQPQKPLQQHTGGGGGLSGGAATAATTGGAGIGSGSLFFGQPTVAAGAAAAAPGSSSTSVPTSLFSNTTGGSNTSSSSATGLPQGSPFGGTNTSALPSSSSLFGSISAPGTTLFSVTGTTGVGGAASTGGMLGQPGTLTISTTIPTTLAAPGSLLGNLSAGATGLSTTPGVYTPGLLGQPASAATGTGTGAAATGAPTGGGAPGAVGLLPLHQQQYLATVDARVQRVESMLANETASMATFVYQYEKKERRDAKESAAATSAIVAGATGGLVQQQLTPQQHNEAMEMQLQQLLLTQPSDAGVRLLIRKWKRAKEENPDPKNCRIVLIQGTKQLSERVAAAAQLTQLLLRTIETVGNNTDQLLTRNQELFKQVDLVRERHRLLGHEFIRVLHLIEQVAVERGVCERNIRCEKANAPVLAALSAAFPWEEWQRRMDLLRVWTAALNRSAAAVSSREGAAATVLRAARRRIASGADESGKGWLTLLQEEAEDDKLKDVARVLAAQGGALEELNLSLAYSEQQTELIEDATLRALRDKQDEAPAAAAGRNATTPAKKGWL